ncbi:13070_t:CDS:2 [Funneliformis geosporum]|nr:13070_t:CDS:2 [Funneliformis geosporum]
MWTLSAGIRPLCNRAHDLRLATEISLGLRPEIIDGTPNVYVQLMKQCWHHDPSKRPTASQICDLLGNWVSAICDDPDSSDLSDQFDIAEEKKFSDLEKNEFLQQQIHYQANYKSRLILNDQLNSYAHVIKIDGLNQFNDLPSALSNESYQIFADKKNSNEINGVLPYTDPEILKGNPPTKSSDIYSFGIIMWTLSAGIRPWCNRPHDIQLATEICFGLRPEIIDGTPEVYIQIMTQCWNSDPSKRPVASQLYELIGSWISAICDDPQQTELKKFA